MEDEIYQIGSELVDYSRTAAEFSARGLVAEMFPFIYEASKRMSARAISRWLKETKGIKVSDVSIAKALRTPEKYWEALADEVEPLALTFEAGTGVAMEAFLLKDEVFSAIRGDRQRILDHVDSICNSPDELEGELARFWEAGEKLSRLWFPLTPTARAACWPYFATSKTRKEGDDE
ncbi:MAG: hypothetical protein ACFUZC_20160 [Chthoniobacteraceae bacterium]